MTVGAPTLLTEPEWTALRAAHEARVDSWTRHRRQRRPRGEQHPVDDFLFDYYSTRPGKLREWHPGFGVTLGGAEAESYLRVQGYRRTEHGLTVDPGVFGRREPLARWIQALLRQTRARPAHFGCFGMHEWAMVYRPEPGAIRHPDWPLRLTIDEISDIVDAQGLRCTHFDAYRFFTPAAAPRNRLPLTRSDQGKQEQPGCLHANMDLYKWAKKLSPLVSSDLVADTFELARELRTLDMRASPYDLTGLALEPIRVETASGKATYATMQREFSGRSQSLRSRLLEVLDRCLPQLKQADAA